jgi:hypothetical protein
VHEQTGPKRSQQRLAEAYLWLAKLNAFNIEAV